MQVNLEFLNYAGESSFDLICTRIIQAGESRG
jgi:hypothetical protein